MTRTKKIVSLLLAAGLLAAGGVGAALTGVAAEDTSVPAEGSPAALFTLPQGVTVQSDVSVPDYMLYGKELDAANAVTEYTQESSDLGLEAWQMNGVKFTPSSANRWVEFSNVVDISSFSSNDILFAFTPLATARGNADFNEFNVKLTDAEDEDNYLLIKIKPSQWFPATFTAETAELEPCGYQYGDYRPGYSEGTWGFNDKYYVGFDGTTNEAALPSLDDNLPEYLKFDKMEARHRSIILHYDFADKAVWVTGQQGYKYCIMDLDWSESVGYGKEWDGFSSGKVKLSFCSKQHRSGSPSYMVLNAFNTPLNGAEVSDTQAPVLTFGEEVSEGTAPSALVGRSYSLPTFTCLDTVDGETACKIVLTDPDGKEVTVTDNAFVPEKAGFYTISYSASDKAGNLVQKTLRFTAQKAAPAVSVYAEAETLDVSVGEEVSLPEAQFTAGEGAYIVKTDVRIVRAGYPQETIEVDQGVFIPLFEGEYRAIYSATDWLGFTHSTELVYNVSAADGMIVHGTVQHLRRLFDGVRIILPELNAYDYETTWGTGIAQAVEVTLSGNGQSETLPAGSVFTPDIEKFGTELTVTYTVGGASVESYTVEIREKPDPAAEDYVNDGSYQLDDYFLFGEGVNVEYNAAGEELEYYRIRTEEGAAGSRSFGFANPLQAEGFTVTFFVPATMKNFSALRFSLRDSFDASVGFDLVLEDITSSTDPGIKDTDTFLTTNGGKKYTLYGSYNYWLYQDNAYASEVAGSLTITYRDGSIYDVNGNEVCKIEENVDGRAWKGFASGMVYLDVTFEGVGSLSVADYQAEEYGSTAAIALTSLCGQAFYVTYRETENEAGETQYKLMDFYDLANPLIVLEGTLPTGLVLGQTVSVPAVHAYDALSPYTEVRVTVQSPDGSVVFADELYRDGLSFTVENYGLYYIRYVATDATGNTSQATYTIGASDTTAPTIALSSEEELHGKAGKIVSIPNAVVQDDRDEAPRLFLYVIGPDAAMEVLGEVTAENAITGFMPTSAGRYTLVYYAIDADYNASVVTISVTVE